MWVFGLACFGVFWDDFGDYGVLSCVIETFWVIFWVFWGNLRYLGVLALDCGFASFVGLGGFSGWVLVVLVWVWAQFSGFVLRCWC